MAARQAPADLLSRRWPDAGGDRPHAQGARGHGLAAPDPHAARDTRGRGSAARAGLRPGPRGHRWVFSVGHGRRRHDRPTGSPCGAARSGAPQEFGAGSFKYIGARVATDFDRDDRLHGLLRDTLRGQPASGPCIDAATLAAWAEDALTPEETAAADAHLATCARCRDLAATLSAMAETESAPAAAAVPFT